METAPGPLSHHPTAQTRRERFLNPRPSQRSGLSSTSGASNGSVAGLPAEASGVVASCPFLVTLMGLLDRRGQPAAGDLERVARADLVDRQVGEARHALAGGHGQRAAQRRARRIVGERDAHAAGGGRHHVPVRVLDRGLQAEAAADLDGGSAAAA